MAATSDDTGQPPEACPGCGYSEKHAPDCPTLEPEPHASGLPVPHPGEAHDRDPDEPALTVEAGFVHARPLPSEGQPGKGLVKRLCEARQHIDTVPKSGHNDYYDHDYATYDDVMAAVGPALAEAGVWAFESVEETKYLKAPDSGRGGSQLRLVMVVQVLWTDGETQYKSRWVGTSIDSDSSDKHEYKLYSQLLKYAYAKTLKIETGDPEVDDDAPASTSANQTSSTEQSGGSNGDEPITDGQLPHVRRLARQGKIDLDGRDAEDLTKDEASTLLDQAWGDS